MPLVGSANGLLLEAADVVCQDVKIRLLNRHRQLSKETEERRRFPVPDRESLQAAHETWHYLQIMPCQHIVFCSSLTRHSFSAQWDTSTFCYQYGRIPHGQVDKSSLFAVMQDILVRNLEYTPRYHLHPCKILQLPWYATHSHMVKRKIRCRHSVGEPVESYRQALPLEQD